MNTLPKNQIATDFEGWPLYKQTLKDILIDLGFNIKDDVLCISKDDPILESFVEIAEDDGMGYCQKMQYVTNVDKEYCRLWVDYSQDD